MSWHEPWCETWFRPPRRPPRLEGGDQSHSARHPHSADGQLEPAASRRGYVVDQAQHARKELADWLVEHDEPSQVDIASLIRPDWRQPARSLLRCQLTLYGHYAACAGVRRREQGGDEFLSVTKTSRRDLPEMLYATADDVSLIELKT